MARVRKVRTPAGVKKYGQPIGSIIVADAKLKHVTWLKNIDKYWSRVKGSDGKVYDGGWDDRTQSWVATRKGTWDRIFVEYADTEGEMWTLLDEGIRTGAFKRGNTLYGSQLDFDDSEHEKSLWKALRDRHDALMALYGRKRYKKPPPPKEIGKGKTKKTLPSPGLPAGQVIKNHLTRFRMLQRRGDYEGAQEQIEAAEEIVRGLAEKDRLREQQKARLKKRNDFLFERARRIAEDKKYGQRSITPEAVFETMQKINKTIKGVRTELTVIIGPMGVKRVKVERISIGNPKNMRGAPPKEFMAALTDWAQKKGWTLMIDRDAIEMPKPTVTRLLKATGFKEKRPRADAGFSGTHVWVPKKRKKRRKRA